jgi:hypothetical protein
MAWGECHKGMRGHKSTLNIQQEFRCVLMQEMFDLKRNRD